MKDLTGVVVMILWPFWVSEPRNLPFKPCSSILHFKLERLGRSVFLFPFAEIRGNEDEDDMLQG